MVKGTVRKVVESAIAPDARRYDVVTVGLFTQEAEVLDKIGAIYGMGRSQTVRFIINDWQRMRQEQEQG